MLLLPAQSATPGHTIHVDIVGLRNDRGRVYCALYADEKAFPNEAKAAVAGMSTGIEGRKASCDFHDVPDGTYAVSVFHDENGNGRMDLNLLGIPKEGVGTSNDAKGHMGPPRFKDAKFAMQGADRVLVIHMVYV